MSTGLMTGFETGDTTECQSTSGTFSVQNSVTRGAWSAYALRVNPATTGAGSVVVAGHAAGGAVSASAFSAATVYVRFYFRYDVKPTSNDEEFFTVLTTALGGKIRLRLNSAGNIAAYTNTSVLIATGTATLSSGVWYRVEVKCGSDVGAVVEWKVDGVQDVSTTATLSAVNAGAVAPGKLSNRNGNSIDFYYDDLLVSDSAYPGAGQNTLLLPNANGTYQTGTIGAGAGSHYQNVDEVPHDSDTTYLVTDGTSTHAETEAMADTAGASISGTINSAKALCVLKRDGASNGSVKQRRRSGSTDSDLGSAFASTSAYTLCASILDTDPATSSAWTTSGIDGVEVGVVEQSANKTRMTLVALAVDYTPSGGGSTYSVSVSESGSAADSVSCAATFASSASESGSAADSPSCAATFASSVGESGSASDSPACAAAFSASVTEAGSGGDSASCSFTAGCSVSESGSASDSLSASATFASSVTEPAPAADSYACSFTASCSVSESGTAADSCSATVSFVSSLSEGATAADSYAYEYFAAPHLRVRFSLAVGPRVERFSLPVGPRTLRLRLPVGPRVKRLSLPVVRRTVRLSLSVGARRLRFRLPVGPRE